MRRSIPIRTSIQLTETTHIQQTISSETYQRSIITIISPQGRTLDRTLKHKRVVSPLFTHDVLRQCRGEIRMMGILDVKHDVRGGVVPTWDATFLYIHVRETFAIQDFRVTAEGVSATEPFVGRHGFREEKGFEAEGESILVVGQGGGISAGEDAGGGEPCEGGFVEHDFLEPGVHSLFEGVADGCQLCFHVGYLDRLRLQRISACTIEVDMERLTSAVPAGQMAAATPGAC